MPQPASSPSASVVLLGSAARGCGSPGPASQPAWNSLYASGPRVCVRSVAVANASSARSCSPIAFASLWYQFPIAHTGSADGTFVSNVFTNTGVRGPTTSRACASSQRRYAWKCGAGIRVVVEIRALVVVELHGEHAVGDGPELRERAVQPARGVAHVRRVAHPLRRGVVAVLVLQRRGRGIAAFEHVVLLHRVLRPLQQPRRIAAVAPLVADHRPGPHDEEEAELLAEPQHLAQIAPRAGAPVEVEVAVGELVPVPRHVQVERVRAELAHARHRRAPLRARDALVEERAAEEEERLAVDASAPARRARRARRPRARTRRGVRSRALRRRARSRRAATRCTRARAATRSSSRRTASSARSARAQDRRARPRRACRRRTDARRFIGRPEQKQPAGERDQRRQRVERHAERRVAVGRGARGRARRLAPTPWMSTMPAVSALITASSGSSEAGSASSPIATSATDGNFPLGCKRANGARKSPLARGGVRDARRAEQKPVRRRERGHHHRDGHDDRRTARRTRARRPATRSAVDEAISVGASAAATPRLSSTYAAQTSAIEIRIARGIVRAGAITSSPERADVARSRRSRTASIRAPRRAARFRRRA